MSFLIIHIAVSIKFTKIRIISRAIMSLTTNAISQIYTMAGSQDNPAFTPVVQVIHIKQIEAKGAEDRYKVMFP